MHGVINPRRCAVGYGSPETTGTPTVSLYNNSTGAHLLLVRDFQCRYKATDPVEIDVAIVQGVYNGSTFAMHGVPIFSGAPQPPGDIYVLDDPDSISLVFAFTTGSTPAPLWTHDFPLAVIGPGYSWVAQGGAAATGFNLQIFWEWMTPDDFEHYYEPCI